MAKRRYSKYKVDQSKSAKKKRTVTDLHTGKTITFASLIEQRFYDEVLIPKFKSGEIIDYDLQKTYVLQESFKRKNGETVRKIDYQADYWLKFKDGTEKVIDTKGDGFLVDNLARLKRKLFYYRYPDLDFEWITYSKIADQWINWDEAMKLKRKKKKAS